MPFFCNRLVCGLDNEFSLCLSRACLGKKMTFICKWRKKWHFAPGLGLRRRPSAPEGQKTDTRTHTHTHTQTKPFSEHEPIWRHLTRLTPDT